MKSLRREIRAFTTLAPLLRTAGTFNGSVVDLARGGKVAAVVTIGAITDGTPVFTLQHGNAADASDMAAVSAADLDGAFAAVSANTVQSVGYLGSKRYLRVVCVVTGGSTGGNYAASIVVNNLRRSV